MQSEEYENTLKSRITQFEQDQAKPAAETLDFEDKRAKVRPTNQNPYLCARNQLLEEWNTTPDKIGQDRSWKVREISQMEKTGDTDNRFYAEFVRQVREIGDQLPS